MNHSNTIERLSSIPVEVESHGDSVLQEEDQLNIIKASLYREVNVFRTKYRLPEFCEDQNLTSILAEALVVSELSAEAICSAVGYKMKQNEIEIMHQRRTLADLGHAQELTFGEIGEIYLDILTQMMNAIYRDKFLSTRYNNVSLVLNYSPTQVQISVFLTKTIVSVDQIYLENGYLQIIGSQNDFNYTLVLLSIDPYQDELESATISPNKIILDRETGSFVVKFSTQAIAGIDHIPLFLEFYVMEGKSNIKYGYGEDLIHEDLICLQDQLFLGYKLPFSKIDSIATIQRPLPSLKSIQSSRHLMNSPIPDFTQANKSRIENQKTPARIKLNKTPMQDRRKSITPPFFPLQENNNQQRKLFQEFWHQKEMHDKMSEERQQNPQVNPFQSQHTNFTSPMAMNQNNGTLSRTQPQQKSTFSGLANMYSQYAQNEKKKPPITPEFQPPLKSKSKICFPNPEDVSYDYQMNHNTLNLDSSFEVFRDPPTDRQHIHSLQEKQSPLPFIPPGTIQPQFHLQFQPPLINQIQNQQSNPLLQKPPENQMQQIQQALLIQQQQTQQIQNQQQLQQNQPLIFNPPLFQQFQQTQPTNMQGLYSKPLPPEQHSVKFNDNPRPKPHYIPNHKSEILQIVHRTFQTIANHTIPPTYNPIEEIIDPNLFKGPVLPDKAVDQLRILEDRLEGRPLDRVQQYIQLYTNSEHFDIYLRVRNEEIRAHRVVLLQSAYFEKAFQSARMIPNEPIKIQIEAPIRPDVMRRIIRYMYFSELEAGECDSMTIGFAREMFLAAQYLKLIHLMKILLVKVIIPKMDKSLCLQFLLDSLGREGCEGYIIWKTLQHYTLNYFAVNSKSILTKHNKGLYDISTELVYKLVSKALTKCKDIEHMYELLALLVDQKFADNLLDVLDKIPEVGNHSYKKFDVKYIPHKDEIIRDLDNKKIYETELITCKEIFKGHNFSSRILEERENNNLPSPQKPRKEPYNHLELNMKYNPTSTTTLLDTGGWPEIKRRDPNYEMKIDISNNFKNKTIISQSFDSDSRSWSLVLDVEEDQKLSVFLMERGLPHHKKVSGLFKYEFTAVKFLIQVRDTDTEYESVIFHCFANDHNYCIGHRRMIPLNYLTNKNILNLKIWMLEAPAYGCCIQYLSTRFNELFREVYENNEEDDSKIIRHEEKSFLGTQKNNLNQPKSKRKKTDDDRRNDDYRKRKSMSTLEINFFKRPSSFTNQSDQFETVKENDPLALNTAAKMMKGNNFNDGNINFLEQIRTNNRSHNNVPSFNNQRVEHYQSKEQNRAQTAKLFLELSPFDFYYLTSSDFLTIEHEKFLTIFLYKYINQKSEEMASMIVYGLRFSFVELSRLFNMARDMSEFRQNKLFISKLDFEVANRISSNQPFDGSRRFYSNEMYKGWNFKEDLMKWLIESDHHQGYRLKNEELKQIINDKEAQLKNQAGVINHLHTEVDKLHYIVTKQMMDNGVKRIRPNNFGQSRLASAVEKIRGNCQIF